MAMGPKLLNVLGTNNSTGVTERDISLCVTISVLEPFFPGKFKKRKKLSASIVTLTGLCMVSGSLSGVTRST